MIHGLSVPAIIWKDVAPQLAMQGFRILLYGSPQPVTLIHNFNDFANFLDLYGRGYSDAPQITYDNPLYTTQLALLMQHVGWSNADIVGVSMVCNLRFRRGICG